MSSEEHVKAEQVLHKAICAATLAIVMYYITIHIGFVFLH